LKICQVTTHSHFNFLKLLSISTRWCRVECPCLCYLLRNQNKITKLTRFCIRLIQKTNESNNVTKKLLIKKQKTRIELTWKNLEKRSGDGKGGCLAVDWSPLEEFPAIAKTSEFQFLHQISERSKSLKQSEKKSKFS